MIPENSEEIGENDKTLAEILNEIDEKETEGKVGNKEFVRICKKLNNLLRLPIIFSETAIHGFYGLHEYIEYVARDLKERYSLN